jgi:hypothetical protein
MNEGLATCPQLPAPALLPCLWLDVEVGAPVEVGPSLVCFRCVPRFETVASGVALCNARIALSLQGQR